MLRLNLIGLGVAAGVGLGLLYGLVISPVSYTNTSPVDLRADYQEQYIIMTAASYHATGDLSRAQNRLTALALADPAETVTALAQRAAAQQRDEQVVAWLGELAFALGVALEPVTSAPPAPAPTATPVPAAAPATPTLEAAQPEATAVPSPTATPVFDYLFVSQEDNCDPRPDAPQLQVEIVNALGDPLPGVLVVVSWPTGEDTFYTGLKPEISAGYGDFTMDAEEAYSVQVGSRTPPITDIRSPRCTDADGAEYAGSVLITIQRGE